MGKNKTRMLNVRLEEQRYVELEEEADRQGITVSELVREILGSGIENADEPQKKRWRLARAAIEEILSFRQLPLEELWLYGSVARGEANCESDIDLLVVLDIESDERLNWRRKIYERLMELEWEYLVHFSLQIFTSETWKKQEGSSFRREVEETGIRFTKYKDKKTAAEVAA